MKRFLLSCMVVLTMAPALAYAHEISLLPTLPLPLSPVSIPHPETPAFDFAECIAKVSAGCHASGYPQCTEWTMAICRDKLSGRFPSCFEAVEASCRRDGFPNCPEYALAQCRQ